MIFDLQITVKHSVFTVPFISDALMIYYIFHLYFLWDKSLWTSLRQKTSYLMVRAIDQSHIVFFTQNLSCNLQHTSYIHKCPLGKLALQTLRGWKDGQVHSPGFCFSQKGVHFIKSGEVSFSAVSGQNCAWSSCSALCIMWIWNIIHKMSWKSF